MRTTIDKAGRVIIPAAVRARVGLVPGPVDIVVEGTGIRIEVPAPDNVIEQDGRMLLTGGGPELTADDIRELRLADQR